jgi:hypothetical protein
VSRRERIVKELIVEPGTEANIAGRDPAWTGGPEFEELSAKELSHTAKALLHDGIKELSKAQELLWASDTYAGWWCSRPWTRPARTPPSSTSCPG